MRLTDITIKALKAPPKGVIYYTDDTLTGFGVRVSEGGTKSFILMHGMRRTYHPGIAPNMCAMFRHVQLWACLAGYGAAQILFHFLQMRTASR